MTPTERSPPWCLIDGRASASLPADDRGLAYGDGLFETVRFVAGRAPLWRWHLARLRLGAGRLRLSMPDPSHCWHEAQRVADGADCIVKLILTRGGGRGYAPMQSDCRRIVLRQELPALDQGAYCRGLRLRWCRLRLAQQPALAGLKHLNRLEQVLARAEWHDRRIDEGLLLDTDGRIVSATAANVFLVRDGRLLTPSLHLCGVAGVARAWLLARARRRMPVQEVDLRPDDLAAADELFLSNAVRGVVPVRALGRQHWPVGPVTQRLSKALAGLGVGVDAG